MTLNVCPADTVNAPVERVWALLTKPEDYGRFFDLDVERVDGRKIVGSTRAFGKRWSITGEIEEIDASRHQIRFRMSLPFGVVGINRIGCQPLDAERCLVRFD